MAGQQGIPERGHSMSTLAIIAVCVTVLLLGMGALGVALEWVKKS